MKTIIKSFLITYAFLILGNGISAQNNESKTDDLGRIALNAYIPEQAEGISSTAKRMLMNKLNQVATRNGMAGSSLNPRFIIVPNITVLSKDITPTAPPMIALTLEVTFYIGDGIEGKLFSSSSIEVKGVGTNETKAYISAIRQIKPTNSSLRTLVKNGKTKIIEYYNDNCDFIIKQAQTLETQQQYGAAIFQLMTIPPVCKECYNKCMDYAGPLYQKYIDKQCKIKLSEAQNAWKSGQDVEAATKAANYLSEIDPNAACYSEAIKLTEEIGVRVKEIDQREWDFTLKIEQDMVNIQDSLISATKEIGVAYGTNQPKDVKYNINGWW